jgi:hypothetical protein
MMSKKKYIYPSIFLATQWHLVENLGEYSIFENFIWKFGDFKPQETVCCAILKISNWTFSEISPAKKSIFLCIFTSPKPVSCYLKVIIIHLK